MSETDYKKKCDELTAEVESLTKVCDILKAEVDKWKRQHDETVIIHNELRDQLMTTLANAKFFTSAQLTQQDQQIEKAKAQLAQKK